MEPPVQKQELDPAVDVDIFLEPFHKPDAALEH